MAGNHMLKLALLDRPQVLGKVVPLSKLNLTNLEEATSRALDAIYKV